MPDGVKGWLTAEEVGRDVLAERGPFDDGPDQATCLVPDWRIRALPGAVGVANALAVLLLGPWAVIVAWIVRWELVFAS